MINADDKNFSKQAPGVYKWSIAAVGFISATASAASYFNPDSAGLMLAGTVLMVLLIFVLYSIEKGDQVPQFRILSWFAALMLIASGSFLVSSIFFQWPLYISLSRDHLDQKYLTKIKRYEMADSYFTKTDEKHWTQVFLPDLNHPISFVLVGQSSDYMLLYDAVRKIYVRFPTRGGILQWSNQTDLTKCTTIGCWVDNQSVALVAP